MATIDSTYRGPNSLRHYMVGLCTIVAIATPLYVHFASFGWVRGGGTIVRPAPPNLETALGWALWFTQAGAIVGAIVVAVLAAVYRFADHDRRRRLSATIARCLVVELIWVVASMLDAAVIVNGLLMT